jgi:hypothetical protein
MQGFPGGLRAVNHVEAESLDQFVGKEVLVSIRIPRNLKFHRKFMSLLKTALSMADTDFNFNQFRAAVTVGAGYCTFSESRGQVVAIPKSISFASMDDSEFERLYQDAITFICDQWVVDENTLNQVLEYM